MTKKETMVVLLLLVIFFTVGIYLATGASNKTEFNTFRKLASRFVSSFGNLRTEYANFESGAYLYDVIQNGYSEPLTSPFNSDEVCNPYESRIQVKDHIIYVTLRCSNYLIYNQSSTTDRFTVYKISDWTEEKIEGSNVQMTNFYNYEKNGVLQLPKYYVRKEFYVNYYNKTGHDIYEPTAIDSKYKLLEKTYYRTMDEVK